MRIKQFEWSETLLHAVMTPNACVRAKIIFVRKMSKMAFLRVKNESLLLVISRDTDASQEGAVCQNVRQIVENARCNWVNLTPTGRPSKMQKECFLGRFGLKKAHLRFGGEGARVHAFAPFSHQRSA